MDLNLIIHVGLHKTGTTFFQKEVFSRWPGICFLADLPLGAALKTAAFSVDRPIVVSRENLSGQPFEPESGSWFGDHCRIAEGLKTLFPSARMMVSFRKQDKLILSLYKQYLHSGGVIPFEEFFDIRGDAGLIKQSDLLFVPRFRALVKDGVPPPFVFFLEDLQSGIADLLADMREFMQAGPAPRVSENPKRRNIGVGHHQAALLRKLNQISRSQFNPRGLVSLDSPFMRRLGMNPRRICQHRLAFASARPIELSPEYRSFMDQYYQSDWTEIRAIGAEMRRGSRSAAVAK